MLKLYGYWRSTAAYRVRIALNIKEQPYQQESIHLVKDGGYQHQDAFRELNPQGLVPVLTDNDFTLHQSLAIIDYLEEKFATPSFLPQKTTDRAVVRAMAYDIACDIHPLNNLRVLQYLTKSLNTEDFAKNRWYQHWIATGFGAFEKRLSQLMQVGQLSLNPDNEPKFCWGDTPTVADICLIPQVYNAHRFDVDMSPYPLISAINAHCLTINAFKQATPENQPDAH
ncbi:MAG: maleylacetoacetate isomerase [Pseudomonadota bacterium]